ncbi:NADPH-dependent ferric siderophore reductase, contains FAD-binding and SIP domains [Nocardioides sp. YR527]|uniref:siderophore-interacting protein n=1 Tax=Nocardioides sp. YR527 TaxID=1881028 RepID=UPI0008801FC7|nr:siderophore-interacting protein [Nocardioides sp. YR527]SDK96131.1 NADPH-dependent ferric siderophore reductase, contains FAD-binding and SIP domains [Nocardioides sp. YR527]
MSRPAKPETILVVTATERLSPTMIRVSFRSEDLSAFSSSLFTDRYVKLVFPQKDDDPVVRTYTALNPSVADGTLDIDFVVHGTEGYAGPWAAAAKPGDTLAARGPGGAYSPAPEADWHLIAGDETALPAIRAALAALPADARGYAVIDIPAPGHEQPLDHPDGVEVTWLVTGGHTHHAAEDAEGHEQPLVTAIRDLKWLDGRVHAFVHGEAAVTMHGIRPYLLKERGVPKADVSISGYWRRGRTEETFRDWKRELAEAESA